MRLVPALKAVIAVETGCAAVVWGIFGGVELARGSAASVPFVAGNPAPAGPSVGAGSAGGERLPTFVDPSAQLPTSVPARPTTTIARQAPTTVQFPDRTVPPSPTTTATTVPPATTTTTDSPPTTAPSPPSTTNSPQSGS